MTGAPERGRARAGTARVLLVAALAGAATLAVELSAVRLLAPWFGTSAAVWTNVIGVILLALSLGYLAGARLAARPRPARALALVLFAAAALTAWLPLLGRPVCGLFLPEGLALESAVRLSSWGSLAAAALLFLLPAALLGCVGPLAVELVALSERAHAGTAGGQVLCASTLGSLAGTFATTHLLIPRIGIGASLVAAAAVLFAAGLVAIGRGAGGASLATGLAAATAILPAAFLSRVRRPFPGEGLRELAFAESPYQSLRVVEDTRGESPLRLLQVNEGLDSFQSVWQERPGLLGQGYYYDLFALPAWWARSEGRWKVLVLGLGAGTAFRVLEGASPPGLELDLAGVELDPWVVALGREWFDLTPEEGAGPRVIAGADARAALRALEDGFDLIVLDAYAHQVEIPAHLATVEFFSEVRSHLGPGGWLAVNVGAFGSADPLLEAVAGSAAAGMGSEVLALRVPRARNWVLFARRGAALPEVGKEGWRFDGPVAEALLGPLELPGASRLFRPGGGGPLLTDDHSPTEHLQLRSLEEGRARFAGGG